MGSPHSVPFSCELRSLQTLPHSPLAWFFHFCASFPVGFLPLAHEPRLNPSFCHFTDQAFLFLSLLSYKYHVWTRFPYCRPRLLSNTSGCFFCALPPVELAGGIPWPKPLMILSSQAMCGICMHLPRSYACGGQQRTSGFFLYHFRQGLPLWTRHLTLTV